jgi:hypothetical protein
MVPPVYIMSMCGVLGLSITLQKYEKNTEKPQSLASGVKLWLMIGAFAVVCTNYLLQFLNKVITDGFEQMQAGVTAKYAVIAVGVYLLTEHLALLHIGFAHLGKIAEVHIVVGRAMNEQQVAQF